MYTLLVGLSVIIAILLIVAVLLQSSKGGGLSGSFGGAAGNFGTVFGTRRTADFLIKATWVLAATLTLLILVINIFLLPSQLTGSSRESVIQGKQQIPTTPSLPANPSTTPSNK